MHLRLASLLCCVTLLVAPVVHAQSSQQSPQSISVTGDIAHTLTLTAADLAAMPRAKVETISNGITTVYEGVLVSDVLKKAGAPTGPAMRGAALAGYMIAWASDGYRVVFSLGELDPDITDGQFLLADSANGKPLFGESGAFRLVVPKDKRGARGVRMLTSLTVIRLPK